MMFVIPALFLVGAVLILRRRQKAAIAAMESEDAFADFDPRIQGVLAPLDDVDLDDLAEERFRASV